METEEIKEKKIEDRLKLENQFKSGANWFFWIGGLSIINSVILLTGGEWNFIVGLGITQIVDVIGAAIAKDVGNFINVVALGIDLFIAGIFILFGVFARKRRKWAFGVGMVLYALDGVLFLLASDFLGLGFHVFALIFIFGGFTACKKLIQFETDENLPSEPDALLISE